MRSSTGAVVLATIALSSSCVGSLPAGEFTWVAGPSTSTLQLLGEKHSDADGPSPRCCAQSWTTADSLYLFGGASTPFLGDMWRLDLAAEQRQWQRVVGGGSGDPNDGGNATVPSSRSYGVTWTEGSRLWLWGGFGSNRTGDAEGHLLTDMWSFDTTAAVGAGWRREPQHGPSRPQGRNWCNFWAAEGGRELWLHSGMGGDLTTTYGYPISDLWRFDVGNGSWTQIYDYSCTGAPIHYPWTCGANPGVVYSLEGQQPGMRLKPGYRSNSYTATDGNGDLWLYGGEGGITFPNGTISVDGDFQDVWRFSRSNLSWVHVAGPTSAMGGPPHVGCSSAAPGGCEPRYGVRGVASAVNLPPAEHAGLGSSTSMQTWIGADRTEKMLLFGGENGSEASGMRNGLWSLELRTALWTWEAAAEHYVGSPTERYNGSAWYGTKGKASKENVPGARYAGQAWVDRARGLLWLFGGYGLDANGTAGYLADLWTYSLT